ncbi:hypothetical protein ACO0RG_003103 [Hanseniaspora osmophila]
MANPELARLQQDKDKTHDWKKWGPYLSERSWGTVREDYSSDGNAWMDFDFVTSHARIYRWCEDGIFGVCDSEQKICMSLALWNGKDSILKEKYFGLSGPQGNHGEDVKELYYYLENVPTHSYMKSCYKYPFAKKFPYKELLQKNKERGYQDKEFEIYDINGLFYETNSSSSSSSSDNKDKHASGENDDIPLAATKSIEKDLSPTETVSGAKAPGSQTPNTPYVDTPYFDTFFEMCKNDNDDPEEIFFRITVYNRSSVKSNELYLVPQVFFRNTWSWGVYDPKQKKLKKKTDEMGNEYEELQSTGYEDGYEGEISGYKPIIEKYNENCLKITHRDEGVKYVVFAPSPGIFEGNEKDSDHQNAHYADDDIDNDNDNDNDYADDENAVDDIVPKLLFTDNESNLVKLFGEDQVNLSKYTKDAFHEYIIDKKEESCNFETEQGTKACAMYYFPSIPPQEYVTIRYKMTSHPPNSKQTEKPIAKSTKKQDAAASGAGNEEQTPKQEDIEAMMKNNPQLKTENTNPVSITTAASVDKTMQKKMDEYIVKGDSSTTVSTLTDSSPAAPSSTEEKSKDKEINAQIDDEFFEYFDEEEFDVIFDLREYECSVFYNSIINQDLDQELQKIERQAFAGILWSKQFYHLVQENWSNGDPNSKVKPLENRANGRNAEWKHLYCADVLSLPDKWEYPYFASWDTAFHCIPIAMIDPEFAKNQLDLMTREWYMHPNGQIPAYEWNFSDVNPPVHAWAAYRVYKIEKNMTHTKQGDRSFLEKVFQKLLLNFTWWVNRKDSLGKNIFEGGFLGLDNIGIFNRSEPLPTGGILEQADSTGWMAFFSLQMLNISLELAKENSVYEDIASKFFQHFILISDALSYDEDIDDFYKEEEEEEEKEEKEGAGEDKGGKQKDTVEFGGKKKSKKKAPAGSLWNPVDKFYYDAIAYNGGANKTQLPIRSLVGLIPMYAVLTLEPQILEKFPNFKKRIDWFLDNKPKLCERNIASITKKGTGDRLLLSLLTKDRLCAIMDRLLDEEEFLSPYGIRSLSKYHLKNPFSMHVNGADYSVSYLSGESNSGLFGGNSSWRGAIWFPTNFLIIESLERLFLYYGTSLKFEFPKKSGIFLNLAEIAEMLQHRLIQLFLPDVKTNTKVCYHDEGEPGKFMSNDPYFKEYIPFYEYFDGDNGRGLGASHQCGWTALVAKLIQDHGHTFLPFGTHSMNTQFARRSSSATSYDSRSNSIDESNISPEKFAKLRFRRRSSRSLVNLAGAYLDLSKEEVELNKLMNAKSKK